MFGQRHVSALHDAPRSVKTEAQWLHKKMAEKGVLTGHLSTVHADPHHSLGGVLKRQRWVGVAKPEQLVRKNAVNNLPVPEI